MATPIFLNTFVQDCEYFENRPLEPGYIIIRKGTFNEIKSEPLVSRSSFESVRTLVKFMNSCSLVVVVRA